jgi:uncharacterized Zn finger protein
MMSKMIGLVFLAAAAAVASLGVYAAAAESAAAPQAEDVERERRVDARTERARRDAVFNRLDGNGDGYLSRAEWNAQDDLKPAPEALDRDNDGQISRTEFAAVEITTEISAVGRERQRDKL